MVQQQSRLVLFFFFFLSQLVAKLNVLVREMTHQQPEVLRGDGANFSFTSLSIASVLVFTAAHLSRLVILAWRFSGYCCILVFLLY